jgi:hypothetical protein
MKTRGSSRTVEFTQNSWRASLLKVRRKIGEALDEAAIEHTHRVAHVNHGVRIHSLARRPAPRFTQSSSAAQESGRRLTRPPLNIRIVQHTTTTKFASIRSPNGSQWHTELPQTQPSRIVRPGQTRRGVRSHKRVTFVMVYSMEPKRFKNCRSRARYGSRKTRIDFVSPADSRRGCPCNEEVHAA